MNSKYDRVLKTLGPLAAYLITTLYSQNRTVFHLREAVEILTDDAKASKVLAQLIKNGVIMRLTPGCFRIVPYELGFEREFLGNPYIVGRELALKGKQEQPYYLSHSSAFDLHQMVTQPQFVVYITSPKLIRTRIIQGTEFRFVRCKSSSLFGLTDIWVEKNEKICVSDLERTLLDGLKHPSYCGGFSEVAKGFSIKKQDINSQKLIDYANRLNVGVVIRRLGYLMELYEIGNPTQWQFLQSKLTKTYHLLDPDLADEGKYIVKWRLRLNIPQEELIAIRGT